ncbi:BTAD domain-containing putative transcriptional regulator [Sulfitobacter sp. MF3-043]|uniref:BTAD domain-containing putative transcriptional regulator n=1 Tax=Sulfitobacter sediminivivens TaxID=3252902 RepID=UPI0036DC7648
MNSISLRREIFTTDIDDLLNEIKAGSTDSPMLKQLPLAHQLFVGVDGLNSEFDDWLNSARSAVLSDMQDGLRSIYLDEIIPQNIRIFYAQAALLLDDLDEEAVRTLMLCYAAGSNPTAALRAYNDFYKRLEDNLDAEPAIATQDLAVQIKLSKAENPSQEHTTGFSVLPAAARTGTAKIAIMPFEIVGGQNEDPYLPIGVLDHITCHMASFRAPAVISSNSTRRFLGQVPRPTKVARELDANYVLTGTIRIDGADAGVSVQLAETQSESVLWAKVSICKTDDLKSLNVPIAEEIARAIVPSVDAEELRHSKSVPAEELEPYHLVLQAKDLVFRLKREDFVKAGNLLLRAVDNGPQFSPAHALIAEWYSINLWEGWSKNAPKDRAALEHHALKAIALSPGDGRVMALWAHNRMMFEREYDSALSTFHDAIELCPNDADTLAWSVPTLANTRNSEAAVLNAKKALALSPYDPFIFRNEHFLGLAHYMNGDFDTSAEYGLRSFRRAPNYQGNIRSTIAALCAAGRQSETVHLVEHHNKIAPGFSVAEFKKKHGLRDPGDREVFASRLIAAGLPS